jgi:hypothetical protein
MNKILKFIGVAAAIFSFTSTASAHGPFEEIMKKGFKGSKESPALLKKVTGGSATAEEKAKLAEYIKKLATLKPEKGDAASWKEKTDALVKAIEKDDVAALKEASNCKACHNVHK